MTEKSTEKNTDKELSPSASFEDAVSIVEKMEKGDLPLDEALTLFERGVGLAKQSQNALNKAEQRVQILMQSQQGDTLTDFNDTADNDV
jgi:exodeoxyribonuclease VII small subunit